MLRFDDALAALDPAAFAESMLRAIGAEVVAAGEGFRFGRERAGDLALLERLGFDVRRVPLVDNVSSSHVRELLAAGDVAHAATLLGRPPEVEGIVVMGDQRGRLLGFPTANLETPPELLVPALGIYAGATLGHRTAISIGTNPHYHGTERRVEGAPARLRRRPLRAAARLRALAAAPGRGGVRLGGRADRGDRPRRRADARGRAPRLSRPQVSRRQRRLSSRMEASCAVPAARRPRERPLPRVRRDLLEAGRGRHGPEEPRLPRLRLRRLDPDQPAAGAGSAAPLRRGSAAAPARSRRADAAEVVVPLRPAPDGEPARLEHREPVLVDARLGVRDAVGDVHARTVDGRPAARGPRRGSPRRRSRAPSAGACRRRRRSRARARAPSKTSVGAIMLCIRAPGTSGPRSRSASPSMLFRCRSRPGSQSPEPSPRLVVSTHALPSRSTVTRFVVCVSGPRRAVERVDERDEALGRREPARATAAARASRERRRARRA